MSYALHLFPGSARQTRPSRNATPRIDDRRRHTVPSGHRRPTVLTATTTGLLGLILLAGTAQAYEVWIDDQPVPRCTRKRQVDLLIAAKKAVSRGDFSVADELKSQADQCGKQLLIEARYRQTHGDQR